MMLFLSGKTQPRQGFTWPIEAHDFFHNYVALKYEFNMLRIAVYSVEYGLMFLLLNMHLSQDLASKQEKFFFFIF